MLEDFRFCPLGNRVWILSLSLGWINMEYRFTHSHCSPNIVSVNCKGQETLNTFLYPAFIPLYAPQFLTTQFLKVNKFVSGHLAFSWEYCRRRKLLPYLFHILTTEKGREPLEALVNPTWKNNISFQLENIIYIHLYDYLHNFLTPILFPNCQILLLNIFLAHTTAHFQ